MTGLRRIAGSLRPCWLCGFAVYCEPNYPKDVRVVCARCLRAAVGDRGARS